MIIPLHLEPFARAFADFNQKDPAGILQKGISGEPLENGDFIFYTRDDGKWKMVLTTNQGEPIKDGYVMEPGTNWKDPSTWTNREPGDYFITNFNGRKRGETSLLRFYCYHFNFPFRFPFLLN